MAEQVGIKVNVSVDGTGLAKLNQIYSRLKTLTAKTWTIRVTVKSADALKQINKINSAVNKVGKNVRKITLKTDTSAAQNNVSKLQNSINRIGKTKAAKVNLDTSGAVAKNNALERQVTKTVSKRMNLILVGRGITNIGSILSSIGNNFVSRIGTQLGTTLMYDLISPITEGFGKISSRYDTLTTYPKLIAEMFGGATAEVNAFGESLTALDAGSISVEKLDQSVRGFSTGLDEITNYAKRFVTVTGDIEKGTNLAIAANYAFLASSSSAEDTTTGMRMLQTLQSVGKLTKKQWDSVFRTMPIAISTMAKEVGMSTSDLQAALYAGTVSAEEFTDALINIGTGSGELVSLAEISKQTLSAVSKNMANAVSRLGYNVLKSLSDVFAENVSWIDENAGDAMVQVLLKVNEAIDTLSEGIQNWIRNNPDVIMDWFDKIANYNWSGLVSGVQAAFGAMSKVIGLIAKLPAALTGFMLFGGSKVLGGMFTAAGRLLSGLSEIAMISEAGGIIGALTGLFKRTKNVEKAAKTAETASKTVTKSLKSIGLNFVNAASVAAQIVMFGAAFATVAKEMEFVANLDIQFKSLAKNFAQTAASIALITAGFIGISKAMSSLGTAVADSIAGIAVVAASVAAFTAAAYAVQAISKLDLGKFTDTIKQIGKIGVAVAAMAGELAVIGAISSIPVVGVSEVFGAIAALLSAGTFFLVAKSLDKIAAIQVPSDSKIESVMGAVSKIIDAIGGLSGIFKSGIKAGNLASTMDQLNKALDPMSEALDAFAKIPDKLKAFGDVDTSSFETARKSVSKLKDALTGDDGIFSALGSILNTTIQQSGVRVSKPIFSNKELKTLTSISTSLGTIFDGFADTITAISGFADTFKNVGIDKNGWADISTAVSDITGAIYDMLYGESDTQTNLAKLKEITTGTQHIDVGAINTAFDGLLGMVDVFADLQAKLAENGDLTAQTGGQTGFATVSQQLSDMMAGLGDIFTALGTNANIEDISNAANVMPQLQTALGTLKDVLSAYADLRDLYSGEEAISSLGSAFPALSSAQTAGTDTASAGLTGIVGSLINMVGQINTGFASVDTDALVSNIANVQSMMSTLGDLLETISSWGETYSDATGETPPIVTSFVNMVDDIVASFAAFDAEALLASVQQMEQAIQTLSDIMTNLAASEEGGAGEGASTFASWAAQIGQAASSLASQLASCTSAVEAFVAALNTIPTALSAVSSAMAGKGAEWKAALVNGFKGTATAIVSEVASIAGRISAYTGSFAAAGAAAGSAYASAFNAAASAASVPSVGVHTGGYISGNGVIYRAKGGIALPWKKKGTDTIPAMLTRGEYVQSKRATSYFGVKFMERINNLDIAGALRSISHRDILQGVHSVYNVNNTTNDNRSVNMTINNASQGYSFGRANRYIRGLT